MALLLAMASYKAGKDELLGGSNSVVECDLAKVEVASSNLVSRSICNIKDTSKRSQAPYLHINSLSYIGQLLYDKLFMRIEGTYEHLQM